MPIPTRKLETMAYQAQQAKRQLEEGKYDSSAIWICAIENTAIRWGSPEVKELSTRAWKQIKAGDYEDALETIEEIEELLEELLEA